jgi:hypothetical protein
MKPINGKKTRLWTAVIWMAAVMIVITTFSPVVLHPGRREPALFSLPYTLWTGIVSTILLVLLTYLSSRIRDKF